MSRLGEYIEEIVKPTFKDFERDSTRRHAFLAAVAIYHSIDRAKEDRKAGGKNKGVGGNLERSGVTSAWRSRSSMP